MAIHFLKFIEVSGLIFGLAYVIGAILEKKWCWYAGIIATIFYGISVFYYKIYGEFILQFFYLAVSIYGLSNWSKKPETHVLDLEENIGLQVSKSSFSFLTKVFLMGSLFSLLFYLVLIYFKGSFPFWDAVTSGFGISTTYMTAKKKIENWIFWIAIDIILAVILYFKGLPLYSGLYLIYTVSAIIGFITWQKELNKKALIN